MVRFRIHLSSGAGYCADQLLGGERDPGERCDGRAHECADYRGAYGHSKFNADYGQARAGVDRSERHHALHVVWRVFARGGVYGWAVFTPSQELAPNSTYTIQINSPGKTVFVSTFTTGNVADTTPLTLVSSDPIAGQDLVNEAGNATLRFNKPVDPSSFQPGQFALTDLTFGYTYAVNPTIQPDGATLIFPLTPPQSLQELGDGFQINFSGPPITDWLGNAVAPLPAPIGFTTARDTQMTGPALAGWSPATGDSGVAMNSRIILIFAQPLAKLAYASAITLSAGGAPVQFTLDNTLASGRALIVQPAVLFPPNTQVTLQVTGLVDLFGVAQTAPITISFQTGASLQAKTLQVAVSPAAPLPQSAPIQVTFTRPIDATVFSLLGGASVYLLQTNIEFAAPAARLSSDGLTVSLNPPLPAGMYQGQISIPFDPTQGKVGPFAFNFTVTGDIDTTPPQVLAVTPPDGAAGAPPASLIQVAFSEPVIASGEAFQLLENGAAGGRNVFDQREAGEEVPAPAITLDPAANYQIQISGVTDLSGNALAPFSSSFSTGAGNPTGPFQVISITPATGATGVDPMTPIVVTFNRSVNPISALTAFANALRMVSTVFLPAGSIQVNGPTVTVTPAYPLSQGTWSIYLSGVTDLAGVSAAAFSAYFTTAAPAVPDTTPPTVISVSPPDGGMAQYLNPYVVLTFSKPLDPSTVNAANFVVYPVRGNSGVSATLGGGGTQVTLNFTGNPGDLVTIYVNPGVTDLIGNAAVPFRSTIQMSNVPSGLGGAQVIKQHPGYGYPPAPPNTSIYLVFSAPVDQASVEAGLVVAANGIYVPGTVVWTPDSTGVHV